MSAPPASIPNFDLSKDVATLLREGTATAHTETETTKAAMWLTRGELTKLEYARFLIMLWHVYTALEESLERHSSNPVLAPTYNPTVLARSAALSSDIAHLLAVPESSWQQHPLAVSLAINTPKPLADYTSRIRSTSDESPALLLAHAYVRYLGDLSGGQVIRRNIAKAYNLDTETGLGTQFYEFQKLGGGGSANMGDMRKIKQWYRDGMISGVGDQELLKAQMVEEAIVAFRLNAAIFSILEPPILSETEKKESTIDMPAYPHAPTEKSGGLTVGRFLAFLLAIALAQFISKQYLGKFTQLLTGAADNNAA